MRAAASPYYPPRAGRSRYFYRALDWLRYALQQSSFGQKIVVDLPPGAVLKSVVVPGLGFRVAGWERLAVGAFYCWIGCLVGFISVLGHAAATLFFGLMLSIHASSILCVLARVWPHHSFLKRLLLGLIMVILLSALVYQPTLGAVERYCFMPVWSDGVPYVVNRTPWGRAVQRGDLVAYRLPAHRGSVVLNSGISLDRILAGPGDVLRFTKTELRINGLASPRREDMPAAGGLTLGPDVWFIWPSLDKTVRGNVKASDITDVMMEAATVSRSDILGKPFRNWLWRHQNR